MLWRALTKDVAGFPVPILAALAPRTGWGPAESAVEALWRGPTDDLAVLLESVLTSGSLSAGALPWTDVREAMLVPAMFRTPAAASSCSNLVSLVHLMGARFTALYTEAQGGAQQCQRYWDHKGVTLAAVPTCVEEESRI